ncbi:hypothetical protein PGB90_005566 [Kerria lacca]
MKFLFIIFLLVVSLLYLTEVDATCNYNCGTICQVRKECSGVICNCPIQPSQ